MKILHIAYQSLPHISGSSIRSRDVFSSQKKIGLEPVVITSPFQNGISNQDIDLIYDVKHYRTYNQNPDDLVTENKSSLFKRTKKLFSFRKFIKKVDKIYQLERPNIVHAHATFYCGFSALYLKLKYKIPVCYEVRSLWEEREVENANTYLKKLQPKIIRKLETICMKNADQVIVINENLKQDLFERGIRNIKVIPNAVNLSLIQESKEPQRNLLNFGYIGSISPIEGLDLIVKVWKKLENEGYENKFHIYGEGSYLEELKSLTESLGTKQIIFHGNIDSSKINMAFVNIDVIVNPRIRSKITDTVTPLKPLEAMAYQKLVIASDVGGMKELIENKATGILFEHDNIYSLERTLKQVIGDGINHQIVENALNYVKENKSWESNAYYYKKIYQNLL